MLRKQYQYQLFADYFQFYVEDENPEDTTEHIWDDKRTIEIGLALGKGIIAVGTERNFWFLSLSKFTTPNPMMIFRCGIE